MDDHWPVIASLQAVHLPLELLRVPFILWECDHLMSLTWLVILVFLWLIQSVRSKLQVESDGSLEIKLDCTTLVLTFHSIKQFDVNLRPIECTITRVYFPLNTFMLFEPIETFL